jgi:hypothetical protein
MRADDIRKASTFEQLSAQTTVERREEEQLCDHFITTARQRHQAIASRLQEKFLAMMIHEKAAYLNSSRLFWKLDTWEDDIRRRRRLLRNPTGSSHAEATQKSSSNEPNDDHLMTTMIKEENLLKQLKQQKITSVNQTNMDEDELLQVDEKDLDQDFSGPIRFSTDCSLICGTVILRGTLAVTHNAMLFDTDEHDESFTKLDLKVKYRTFCLLSMNNRMIFIVCFTKSSRCFHMSIIYMANGISMKFERFSLDDIYCRRKPWKFSLPIEVGRVRMLTSLSKNMHMNNIFILNTMNTWFGRLLVSS